MSKGDIKCSYCGEHYYYSDGIRCESCDGLGCPACMEDNPEPACPECSSRLLPERISPMLAKDGNVPSDFDAYGFEFKWDGIRAITYWDGREVRIESKNLKNITGKYPELSNIGDSLPQKTIFDGEIIALDGEGKPSFHLLQQRMHLPAERARLRKKNVPVYYHIFDLLYYDDENLMHQSYRKRREILEEIGLDHLNCRIPVSFRGSGKDILKVAEEYRLEGIVCKRLESAYQPGKRSGDWLKVKLVKSREFIICGYKVEKNNPRRIGSIQIGAYDKNMKLKYLGGVGTGFNETDKQLLMDKLTPLKVDSNIYDDAVPRQGIRFVKPRLVAAVEYRRWPKEGIVQQSVYKGLRSGVNPSEVILEEMNHA